MDEVFFIEIGRKGEIELYERDGAFYDHDTKDLLVATFYDKDYANKVAQLLNHDESL
ncbi:MAG: hypothetical protein ACQEXX_01425 [Bacillota bacterium]